MCASSSYSQNVANLKLSMKPLQQAQQLSTVIMCHQQIFSHQPNTKHHQLQRETQQGIAKNKMGIASQENEGLLYFRFQTELMSRSNPLALGSEQTANSGILSIILTA